MVAKLTGLAENEIKEMRHANGIRAAFKMVDTCAAEFAAETPYYYSCFGSENEAEGETEKKKVLVLGSGRSALVRVSSSTSVLFTAPGPSRRRALRPSSSTITRRLSAQTLISLTNCISNR